LYCVEEIQKHQHIVYKTKRQIMHHLQWPADLWRWNISQGCCGPLVRCISLRDNVATCQSLVYIPTPKQRSLH